MPSRWVFTSTTAGWPEANAASRAPRNSLMRFTVAPKQPMERAMPAKSASGKIHRSSDPGVWPP